ncbi:hypothetical protein A4R28_11905 [Mesorhizobium ciceri]|nr:hypothetical protein A4R28_11905 [Mesorhizobium ciceri]
MTPEEDNESRGGKLCPWCGAYSPRQCDLEEETGGVCPWEESEPDPDDIMEARREDREFEAGHPHNGDDF